MKNLPVLITAAFVSVAALTSSAFAGSEGSCTHCAAEKVASTKPEPVSLVRPTGLPANFDEATIELKLTIDENGVPRNVKTLKRVDSAVAKSLLAAVAQWRFKPSYVNGKAVPTQAILPVHLVADSDTSSQSVAEHDRLVHN